MSLPLTAGWVWALLILLPAAAVADAASNGGDWTAIVTNYGVAAPFALLCLWVIKRLTDEVTALRAENTRLQEAMMDRVLPAGSELARASNDAVKSVEAAGRMMHQFTTRTPSAGQLERVMEILTRVETKLDQR